MNIVMFYAIYFFVHQSTNRMNQLVSQSVTSSIHSFIHLCVFIHGSHKSIVGRNLLHISTVLLLY